MRRDQSGQVIGAQMVSATDGSAFTGSVTVHVTGDGGTQATGSVGAGAATHEGNGYHTYAPAQAETDYDLIAFTFVGTGAVPVTVQVFTTDALAEAVLMRDWAAMLAGSPAPTVPDRCLLNAARFLRNAWSVSGSPPTVTITAENDTTPVWSKPVTPAPGADPISGVGADDV